MAETRRVLFIQGGGEGTHDEWDDKLVDSLRRELGDGFEVHYPRLPAEDDPRYATWAPAIRKEVAALEAGDVVVGHSVGGPILLQALVEQPPPSKTGAIILLAAPFVGAGGWPGDEFEFGSDLGDRLPPGVPVLVFHGLDDDTVPPTHAVLYAGAIPTAQVIQLPGQDHQLGNDLAAVATMIRALPL